MGCTMSPGGVQRSLEVCSSKCSFLRRILQNRLETMMFGFDCLQYSDCKCSKRTVGGGGGGLGWGGEGCVPR